LAKTDKLKYLSDQGILSIHGLAFYLIRKFELSGNLLDYGAGDGHFLLEARGFSKFQEIHGVDLRSRPGNLPSKIFWHQHDLNLEFNCARTFDVITCIEVIEHLENPRAVMKNIANLLKPGGHAVITTPNSESLRSYLTLIFGGHFAGFRWEYPRHITPLLRLDLQRIATECGLTKIYFCYTNQGFVPRLTLTWQKLSFGILSGRFFSDVVAMIATKDYR